MIFMNSSSIPEHLSDLALEKVLITTSSLTLCGCVVAVVTKVIFFKVFPNAWKYSLLCQDIAYLLLNIGLLLVSCHVGETSGKTCKAGGFFLVVGVLDIVSSLALMGIVFLLVQNPSKMPQLSTFRWQLYLSFVIPPKVLSVVLAILPVSSLDYFDADSPYSVACFPVRQEGKKGAAFGAILTFIIWALMVLAVIVDVILAVRFWAGPGTRVHASTPSLWQTQKIEQCKSLHKFSMLELALIVVTMFIVTIVVYTNNEYKPTSQWVALLSLATVGLVHVVLAMVQFFMWSNLCCDKTGQKKEPHHRFKKLELIKTEGPGKLRLRVTWAVGKALWKHGLLKVYGPAHIKSWAQEIVVLGLLRKSYSASVLQCLWTSNTNPYHEAMTLLSGDIVTSDSRLTCLELTSSGTLQELLHTMEVPLPDSCQRVIMQDIARGLSCLHDLNVLHRNLTSATVYLKGSVQRLVLRAAIGDFEDAQIYGTLLTGSVNSTVSKKRFFLPDSRSYALVGIELLTRVCECRQRERRLHCTTSIKTTSSIDDTSMQPGLMVPSTDQSLYILPCEQKSKENELVSELASAPLYGFKQFNNEFLHCAPVEHEYGIGVKETFTVAQNVDDLTHEQTSYDLSEVKVNDDDELEKEETGNQKYLEHNIDNNWKLQTRIADSNQNEEPICKDWNEAGEDNQWEEYKLNDDFSNAKKSFSFTFPNYSIFRGLETSSRVENLDLIEEDIDFGPKKKISSKKGQHAGYVSSVTNDGKEIFIPATYKQKKSGGNSSSGYGSSSGSTIAQTDQHSSAGTVSCSSYKASISHTKKFQITSPFDMTGSEDILEVLPAVGNSEYKLRHPFKEFKRAKEDPRVEQLMANYEERVRKGKMSDTTQYLRSGVVEPKEITNHNIDMFSGLDAQTSDMSPCYGEHNQEADKAVRVSKEQLKNKHAAQRQKIDKFPRKIRDASELRNASISSFHEYTAKSSLRRNKARLMLEKKLGGPHQLSIYEESRGTKGKEVEQKYSSRQRSILSRVPELESGIPSTVSLDSFTETSFNSNKELLTQPYAHACSSQDPVADNKNDSSIDKSSMHIKNILITRAPRRPSAKNRPAPQPPPVPFANPNKEHSLETSQFSHFDNPQSRCSLKHDEGSFTSVEPASIESECTTQSRVREHTSIDQIESAMNDIIQSNISFMESNSKVPMGLRLIDSGFDSDSVTSDESCICAAAALNISEKDSTSYPSEVFSQSKCSCACSNCLGSTQSRTKETIWPDSPDSESWNNSNSFSSYDNNMHRRKLPRKRDIEDSSACILAPDDQYPSSTHHTIAQSANSLHLLRAYSLERRQQRLSESLEPYTSSASETSSAASRHYRQLIKKGIPLRVSVISGEMSSKINTQEDLANTSYVPRMAQEVFTHRAQGEFTNSSEQNSSLFNNVRRSTSFNTDQHHGHGENAKIMSTIDSLELREEDENEKDYYHDYLIPSLEEIIKEIPDETGHFPEETKTFLNRPESELSIKAMKEILSRHDSTTESSSTHLSESMIDKIFSQSGSANKGLYTFSQCEQDFNSSSLKKMTSSVSESVLMDPAGLLAGMDIRHVKYCQTICDGGSLVTMLELLPANQETFRQLRAKLQQNGSVGLISNQILDLIMMCWLNETPPSTTSIVHQLADHVMETEL